MDIRTWLVPVAVAFTVGCHASPDDAAGQARELSDPRRRDYALQNIGNLYRRALEANHADRTAAPVRTITDQTVRQLVTAFDAVTQCTAGRCRVNGTPSFREELVKLFRDMRDIRTLPALIKALDWEKERTEMQAAIAAETLLELDIPDGEKPGVAAALAASLGRIEENRGIDNRMRIAFINTLGGLHHQAATAALVQVVEQQSETQHFLLNYQACNQLARLADPSTVPTFIKALFMFDPTQINRRMNDVAALGLVSIGRPALQPLLDLLAGRNAEANAIAAQYVAAGRRMDPTTTLTPELVVAGEATYVLGQLGLREAREALVAETRSENPTRRFAGALALVGLERSPTDDGAIREAFDRAYAGLEKPQQAQLLAAMQRVYDPSLLPTFLANARRPEDEVPQIRTVSVESYALLANRAESADIRAVIEAEPEDGYRAEMNRSLPYLEVANACDMQLACYIGKLNDSNPAAVLKSLAMIARLGRGDAAAIRAVVARVDPPIDDIRAAALRTLDIIATSGSPEGVAKIDEIERREEGQSSWNHVKDVAQITRARLRGRGR